MTKTVPGYRCGAAAALAVSILLAASSAHAVQLDTTACDQLKQELGALEKSGARVNFDKGAAWAKANLTKDQLSQVEKLIDTEAQYLFRCPQPKRKLDPAIEAVMENGTGSDPDPDAVKTEAKPKPVAAVPATKTAPPKPKSKPTAEAAPVTGTGEASPPPKPKRAAVKPKPADAFTSETAGKTAPAATPTQQ